ncbi:uncharacterized protein [Antedon mediterranea]|uniref:uncharacterized protein n=1 Tax=Antedon mediterranea TaxID=105859 RepID=UPI003AF695B9
MIGYRITLFLLCIVEVLSCNVGRININNSCYDFVKPEQNLTWMDALKGCIDSGGSLASFETDSEQDAVRNHRYALYKTEEKFYIGLYSQGITPMWVSGEYLSSDRWSLKSAPQGDHSCEGTVLDISDNNWLRVMCTVRYHNIGYICEYGTPALKSTHLPVLYPTKQLTTVEETQKTKNDLTALCPSDRFVHGNSCYEFVEDPNTYNWTYAVKSCSSKGGQLVSLETEEENDALINSLKTNYLYKELYIGLRLPKNEENAKWLSGAPLTYNRHGAAASTFRCTTIFAFQSVWFSRPCDAGIPVGHGYICEYTRESITNPVTSGNSDFTANVTSIQQIKKGDDNTLNMGVLISVIIVLFILVLVVIALLWRRSKIRKQHITSPQEIPSTAFTGGTNKDIAKEGVSVPVYMQLETSDIIRETPNTGLEININPRCKSVNQVNQELEGRYYEIQQLHPTETDLPKERFSSKNISRANTVFRLSGRKKFEDKKQSQTEIKSNRPKTCKPQYIAGQERTCYAHSNLGFTSNTCTLPKQSSCSVESEHLYNKPVYDVCGPAQCGAEQIYTIPCTVTLSSKQHSTNIETEHYYSSMTDPDNEQSVQSNGVYFVLEKPDNVEKADYGTLSKEVENEIYESGS